MVTNIFRDLYEHMEDQRLYTPFSTTLYKLVFGGRFQNFEPSLLFWNLMKSVACCGYTGHFHSQFSKIKAWLQDMPTRGPVKLIQRVKIGHSFLVSVKSVPLYHFKLAYVVLHMAVKEFFKPTHKKGKIGPFNLESHFDQP